MLLKNKWIENLISIIIHCFSFVLILISSNGYSQGIIISSGNVVASGPVYLVVNDGGFTNNSTFYAGNSNVMFSGTTVTGNSFIGGSGSNTFNDITIKKSANGVQLNNDINLNGKLFMQSDSLFLNGHNINMATNASIAGESSASQITSPTGGNIILSLNLNSPNAFNPGNIGIELTSAANLGSTIIKRGDKEQTTSNGGKSILRYYDIIPTNNTGLNATVKFYYNDAELNGINEPELNMFASSNGGATWILLGKDGSDISNNWVLKNGIDHFNRLTLASNINNALPLKLISFSVQYINNSTRLQWQTSSEQNTSHFSIERSSDGINFSSIGNVNAAGNSSILKNYEFNDPQSNKGLNYYRLKMVDVDGKYIYSKVLVIKIDGKSILQIFPNPAKNILYIQASGENEKATVQIIDVTGRKVKEEKFTLNGTTSFSIDISGLPQGIYNLLLHRQLTTDQQKFVKQ